jgi:hypothetical protein
MGVDHIALLPKRFEGCHILAQVMRFVRYALDCARITASSEDSESLHAIGYANEPLELRVSQTGPIRTFRSNGAVVFHTSPLREGAAAIFSRSYVLNRPRNDRGKRS